MAIFASKLEYNLVEVKHMYTNSSKTNVLFFT